MKAQGIPRRVRDQVHRRSGGRCEVCADAPAVQIHHRRPRKMGGSRRPSTNAAPNLLALCTRCHGVIESSRSRAEENGWLVPDSIEDPSTVPALLSFDEYGPQPVWLCHDGAVQPMLRWCYRKEESV